MSWTNITSIPGLVDMTKSPYVLRLIMDAIVELGREWRLGRGGSGDLCIGMQGVEVYSTSVRGCISRRLGARDAVRAGTSSRVSVDDVVQFSRCVALEMHRRGCVTMLSDEVQLVVGSDVWAADVRVDLVACGPFRLSDVDGRSVVSFEHKSLQEWFEALWDDVCGVLGSGVSVCRSSERVLEFFRQRFIVSESADQRMMRSRLHSLVVGSRVECDGGGGDPVDACGSALSLLGRGCGSLSGMDFRGVRVHGAQLQNVVLHGSDWSGSVLSDCNLVGADADECDFRDCRFDGCRCGVLPRLIGHTGCVNAVAVTSDHCFVVTGSHDRTARVWDRASGECVSILRGHTDCIRAVAVTSDDRFVVTRVC